MRTRSQKQLYLRRQSASTRTSDELSKMDDILVSLPEYAKLLDMVVFDLGRKSGVRHQGDLKGRVVSGSAAESDQPLSELRSNRGRPGMSAEQVLKAFIVKQYKNCSYRELEELTRDSFCIGKFLGIDPHGDGITYKCLQDNIKRLSEETIDFFLVRLNNTPKTKISKKVLKHARMQQL